MLFLAFDRLYLSTQQHSNRAQIQRILILNIEITSSHKHRCVILLNTLVTSSGRSHTWPHGNGLRMRGSQSTHETYAYAKEMNLVTTIDGEARVSTLHITSNSYERHLPNTLKHYENYMYHLL
jgi:hypothetical protein